MRPSPIGTSDTVVPFAPVRAENFFNDHDPLDKAGQSIMGLLQQAATTAKENCGHALRLYFLAKAYEEKAKGRGF
jgi:hypothetical protein